MVRLIWGLLFGVILCISQPGCGGGGDEQPDADTPAPEQTTEETAPPLEGPPP